MTAADEDADTGQRAELGSIPGAADRGAAVVGGRGTGVTPVPDPERGEGLADLVHLQRLQATPAGRQLVQRHSVQSGDRLCRVPERQPVYYAQCVQAKRTLDPRHEHQRDDRRRAVRGGADRRSRCRDRPASTSRPSGRRSGRRRTTSRRTTSPARSCHCSATCTTGAPIFSFTQSPTGSFAFTFFMALKAEPALKFNYDKQTYPIAGGRGDRADVLRDCRARACVSAHMSSGSGHPGQAGMRLSHRRIGT